MKKFWMLPILAVLFAFAACTDTDNAMENNTFTEDDLEFASLEADVEATFEEVEEIQAGVMEALAENNFRDPVRMDHPIFLWACADVTLDTAAQVVMVDFGEGCEGPDGRVRKGKIQIEYSARRWSPGAYRIITLMDYFVDDKKIEGTRTLRNISADREDYLRFNVTLEGGKCIWPDGTEATREKDITRVWMRGNNPLQDEYEITGFVSGVTREGDEYGVEITETLVHKRACRLQRVFIPVSGTKVVTRPNKPDMTLDYGDGECDNLIEVTVGPATQVIDLSEYRRTR